MIGTILVVHAQTQKRALSAPMSSCAQRAKVLPPAGTFHTGISLRAFSGNRSLCRCFSFSQAIQNEVIMGPTLLTSSCVCLSWYSISNVTFNVKGLAMTTVRLPSTPYTVSVITSMIRCLSIDIPLHVIM